MSQQQRERNMIANDGELSIEDLESISGGVFTDTGVERVTPGGFVFTDTGVERVTPGGFALS